jgi:hypothetical protein
MSSSCGLHRPSSKSALKSTTPTPPPRILRRRDSSTTTQSTGSSKKGKRPTFDDVKAENAKSRNQSHNPSSKSSSSLKRESNPEKNNYLPSNNNNPRRKSADFQWAREDQLSVILEILESESRNTPIWEQPDPFRQHTNHPALQKPSTSPIPETVAQSPQPHPETPIRIPKYNKIGAKEREYRIPAYYHSRPSTKQSQQSLRAPDEMSISESKRGETPETPRPIPHPPRDVRDFFQSYALLSTCLFHILVPPRMK